MYKLYFRYEPIDRTTPKKGFTILDEFIGGDLFGKENSANFFPKYQNTNQPRGCFSVDNLNIKIAGDLASDKQGWNNQRLFIYESYKDDSNLIYKLEQSENNTPFSRVHFWVSIRFVRRANFRYKWDNPHECYMLLLNMEYLWNIVKYQVANPDRDKSKADISIFLRKFYKNAENQLRFFEPVSAPMREWFKGVAETDFGFLDDLFSLLFENPAEARVFNVNNFILSHRVKKTLLQGMKNFKEAFDMFVKAHNAVYKEVLYHDFNALQATVESQEWEYDHTRKYHKIIQELAESLDYDRSN